MASWRPSLRKRVRNYPPEAPSTDWTYEEVLINGDDFYRSLLAGIDQAQESIDFETYIFENDFVGKEFIAKFCDAARRGVTTRIMVDGIGSAGWVLHFGSELSSAGVQFRVYHQLPWERIRHQPQSLLRVGYLLSSLGRLNSRNHRKICVIDGKTAWVGSLNISKVHASKERGGDGWRDTGICVQGVGVQELRYIFETVYLKRWWKKFRRKYRRGLVSYSALVLHNTSRRLRKHNYRALLHHIRRAKKRIWITNSYFVPPRKLIDALSDAATRGVEVSINVPEHSDVPLIPIVTAAFYQALLKSGVKIYEYHASVLHAKSMIVDDWFLVGSSNLDSRSFFYNLEADVVVTGDKAKALLERQFSADISQSKEVSIENLWKRPAWQRLAGRVLLLLKSLL